MNKIIYLLVLVAYITSCKVGEPYLYCEERDMVTIQYEDDDDRSLIKSFIYDGEGVTRDTVYMNVRCIGFQASYDRPIAIIHSDSLAEGEVKAEAGVHFVPFDDEEVADLYVLKANTSNALLPIIILRDESLKEQLITLNIELVVNEYFDLGILTDLVQTVEISEMLAMPSNWSSIFGTYGVVKHQWLTDNTGEKWDEDFFTYILSDINLRKYWDAYVNALLATYNAELAAAGLDPLAEEDGTVIAF